MLRLVSNQTELERQDKLRMQRMKLYRIERLLLKSVNHKRVKSLIKKTDEQLNRARVSSRVKRLVRMYHAICRSLDGFENKKIELAYSAEPTMLDILRRRAARGADMDKVRGKGDYYTRKRIY